MATPKPVKIAVETGKPLNIEDFHELQGDLKELSDENYQKMKNEILETGFAFVIHVWFNPKTKKHYLVDGHQRVKTLKKMIEEGHKVEGQIPVALVQAKNLKEAKRRVLQGISQYGQVTLQGLHDFIGDTELNIDQVLSSFDIPNIKDDDIKAMFEVSQSDQTLIGEGSMPIAEPDKVKPPKGGAEIDPAEFESFENECPRCGFSFDGKGGKK